MIVAVTGSRSIKSFEIDKFIPPDTELIITGGAEGIDAIAEKFADRKGIKKLVIYPDYELYGKSAPLIRDKLIVDRADLVIAIWDGESGGTGYTISYAKRRGVPTQVYIV
ncbi:MAG: DUF2493 domain-containing protein [Clostridia bacterium]|nr:DUF2493 domain-containing protein [Clostridia bacterium]